MITGLSGEGRNPTKRVAVRANAVIFFRTADQASLIPISTIHIEHTTAGHPMWSVSIARKKWNRRSAPVRLDSQPAPSMDGNLVGSDGLGDEFNFRGRAVPVCPAAPTWSTALTLSCTFVRVVSGLSRGRRRLR